MKVLIFGGTTEGRNAVLSETERGSSVTVCVTSEYARGLLPESVDCRTGILDAQAMRALMQKERPDRVIDATHPFAVRATGNIRQCCNALNIPLERILRPEGMRDSWNNYVEWVDDTAGAAEALQRTTGNIFLTTGSHTLGSYADALPHERLYVRVLPTVKAVSLCAMLPPGHVIAMQGPFSAALNAAMYDQLDIRIMVSKDSGENGGVTAKVLPALERDIHVIMIRRPAE